LHQPAPEPGPVGAVRVLPLQAVGDPVRDRPEDRPLADAHLDAGRVAGGDRQRDPRLVALAARGRPAPLPGHLTERVAAFPERAVADHRHVVAARVAAAQDLGDVLVDVRTDERGQRPGAGVYRGHALDLADSFRMYGQSL